MLSDEMIQRLENLARSDDDTVAAIKLLTELNQQQREEALRKELFGV